MPKKCWWYGTTDVEKSTARRNLLFRYALPRAGLCALHYREVGLWGVIFKFSWLTVYISQPPTVKIFFEVDNWQEISSLAEKMVPFLPVPNNLAASKRVPISTESPYQKEWLGIYLLRQHYDEKKIKFFEHTNYTEIFLDFVQVLFWSHYLWEESLFCLTNGPLYESGGTSKKFSIWFRFSARLEPRSCASIRNLIRLLKFLRAKWLPLPIGLLPVITYWNLCITSV